MSINEKKNPAHPSKGNKTRKSKFEYFVEDCKCEYCLYYKHGKCQRSACCCADIRADAKANGRIERKRGTNK